MRLPTFSFLTLCLVLQTSWAQKNKFEKFRSDPDYKAAKVQLLDSSWRTGLIKDKTEIERYNRITFIDSLGKKTVYKPNKLIGYHLGSYKFKADAETNHFYQRVTRGRRLSIYQMEFKPTASEDYSVNSSGKLVTNRGYENLGVFQFFYREADGKFQKIPQEGDFYTPLAEFFQDCPRLSRKIRNKEFGKDDVQQMMNVYNFQCDL